MEQASFGKLGENIISLVELAAVGKWPEAEALHAKAMRQVNALKGERVENQSTKIRKRFDECSFRCGNLLASVFTANGRWQQAELILRKVWPIAQLTLHEGNAEVLQCIQNLTNVLKRHGNLQEAERMSRKAVQICRRCFKEDHTYTLVSKNDLATVFGKQGKWQEAEQMHREVLGAMCRVLGESHADTLSSKNNLATELQEQGKWQEAEEMHREVLEVRCRVLGESHSDTLSSRSNLANVLQMQGKWQEAEEMHREVLEVRCRVLGESHADTLSSKNNLANVLKTQGKSKEAEEMHREVLQVRCRILGESHPETLRSRSNFAKLLEGQGKWQEAEEILREVLEVMCQVLGESHRDTLGSRNILASVLQKQGKWQEAEEIHREVLEARCRVLGESHPDTLTSMTNVARVCHKRDKEDWQFRFSVGEARHTGRMDYAISTVRQAVVRLQGRVDDDHPSLLRFRFALAELLLQVNAEECLQEAEGLLLKLVPALQKRYGPKDPDVQRATGHLVFLLEEAGKDAEEWRAHLLVTEGEADSTAMFSVEPPGEEGWEEVTELLRDVLLKPRTISGGQVVKAANTSDASSSARDAPAASALESASQPSHSVVLKPGSSSRSCESSDATSSDSSALWKAALEEKRKEWAERENLSDPSSSQASLSHRQSDAPAASALESASQPSHSVVLKPGSSSRSCESSDATSSDSSALWKAALEEKRKEWAERENLSDPSSSQASLSHRQSDAPAASALESASQPSHSVVLKPGSSSRSCESSDATSSDSSALWKAALEEKRKERAEREKQSEICAVFLQLVKCLCSPKKEPAEN